MVGQELGGRRRRCASRRRSARRTTGRVEARADLDALDGVDRHHRRGEVGVELAVDRRAPAGGTPSATSSMMAPIGGAGLADAVEILLPARGDDGVRAEERVFVGLSQSKLARSIQCGPICTSAPRMVTPGQHLPRDGAGGDPRGGLAGRGTPAAAVVADAVLRRDR